MGTSRGKREEAHTHTHTFPSSLCSQSKTQENTLSPLYLLCLILRMYIRSTRSTKVNKQKTVFLICENFFIINLSLSFFLIDGLYYSMHYTPCIMNTHLLPHVRNNIFYMQKCVYHKHR